MPQCKNGSEYRRTCPAMHKHSFRVAWKVARFVLSRHILQQSYSKDCTKLDIPV